MKFLDPKPMANSFLTTLEEKSIIFRVGQWVNFSKYRGFKIGGGGHPLRVDL